MKNIKEILKSFNKSDFHTKVDLHIHSTYSDGKLAPEAIVKIAKNKGFKHISISDHNTVNAYLETNILDEEIIIPALEFDCWYRGILVHIIGYGIDVNSPELKKVCAKNKAETENDIVRLFNFRHPKMVIDAIKSAGGIAVLAHPACYWAVSLEHFVKCLIEEGIEGIEVFYPYKRHRGILKFHLASSVERIADKYQLIKTGGSDSHAKF